MKILIIGGTQFIGRAIAETAQRAGHEVVLFNRGRSWPEAPFAQIHGELAQLSQYRERFVELAPEAIIHCIAYTPDDAAQLVAVGQALNCRALVLSSEDCYEAFQGLNRGEERSDFPIREDSPVAQQKYYWRDLGAMSQKMWDYDKNLVTDVVLQGLPQSTIFRLPMVYGPQDKQFAHRHGSMIRHLYDQQSQMILGLGQQQQILHFGYIDNIAAGVVHALDCPASFGKIYNLGELQSRTWRRWGELYAQVAGQNLQIELVPDTWLDPESNPNAPPAHFIADSTAYGRETGFKAPISLETAIRATLEWGLAHPEVLGAPPDYAARLRLLQAWREISVPE